MPSKGVLSKEESVLVAPQKSAEERISATYFYDPNYGNLIQTKDTLGRTQTISYETSLNAYPATVTNTRGQQAKTYYYNINDTAKSSITGNGLPGQVKYTEDANAQKTYNIYDSLGRPVKVIGPKDSETYPGVTYEYELPQIDTQSITHTYSGGTNEGQNSIDDNFNTDFSASYWGGQSSQHEVSVISEHNFSSPAAITRLKYKMEAHAEFQEKYTFGVWYTMRVQYKVGGTWINVPDSEITYSESGYNDGYWTSRNVTKSTGEITYIPPSPIQNVTAVRAYCYSKAQSFGEGSHSGYAKIYEIQAYALADNGTEYSLLNKPASETAKPAKVTQRVKINYGTTPDYQIYYNFYDGLGRLIETKSPAQADPVTKAQRQIVSGTVKYNDKGQVIEKYLPVYVSASGDYVEPSFNTPHSTIIYDALGRVVETINPDGTRSSTIYDKWAVTSIDPSGHKTVKYSDAYGKIVKVEEYTGKVERADSGFIDNTALYATTYYEYDALGNLIKITDAKGNITQIKYDSLGRKINMNDPDMGVWTYEYDLSGNLIKQTDAKGQKLIFEYDNLNRLTKKQGLLPAATIPTTLSTYAYDSGANGVGRLAKITDQSGSTEFFYDELGRETKSIKTVGTTSYAVMRDYDALGRLAKLTYPDNSAVNYEYNPQGITSVTSSTGQTYISNIEYFETGQISKIVYGNGTVTNYAYNPDTRRLINLTTQSASGKIQDLNYVFDDSGNVKSITDYVNTATQSFQYDDLGRLINAAGNYGNNSYQYDQIGNMLSKEGVSMSYGKNGRLPHAVVQYGDTLIDYDANGNMVGKGASSYTYDIENRLIKAENGQVAANKSGALTVLLRPGWNFFALPFSPTDNHITSIFSSIAGKYTQISRYNPASKTFEHFVGDSKFDQFTTIECGRGYQVYISGTSDIALTLQRSSQATSSVALKTGYNLISYPKDAETPIKQALQPLQIGVDYSKVLHYNKDNSSFETFSASVTNFSTFKPGESYFVYCLKDISWTPVTVTPNPTTSFVYDGDGGRVQKTVSLRGAVGAEAVSTTYIGSLFEKDSDGTIRKHVFSGSNRIATVSLPATEASKTVSLRGALRQKTAGTEAISFFHADHLGSSNVVTDIDGKQVGLTEFTPYGSTFKHLGSYEPKFKFTGKELDESGLYYYGARYYDPQLGRFISADPLVQSPYDPQSLNRFSYCRNNPINYIDPTGHKWNWGRFWSSFAGAFVGAVVTVFSGGLGAPLWIASMVGGMTGGALTGGLECGWKGALIGAGIGGALGAFGGWGVGNYGSGFAAGMLVAGAGVAGASNNWDNFAGGLAGAYAGSGFANGVESLNDTDIAIPDQSAGQPVSDLKGQEYLGIGTTARNAQIEADLTGKTVFYTPTRGFVADMVRCGLEKINSAWSATTRDAARFAPYASNINAHSEGAMHLAGAKSLIVDSAKVRDLQISFNGAAVSKTTAAGFANSMGAKYTYNMNWADPIAAVNTFNPITQIVHGILGVATGFRYHSGNAYSDLNM